jgi:mannitol-1-phosphate 5-dehydrogenase
MALTGTRTYVGFGLGAIQAGLFLYEAYQSGAFGRLVVAEVVPEVVAALRGAGGMVGINIAHVDGVESLRLGGIEIEDPAVAEDRERLVAAIAAAHEIGTAVPSVQVYMSPDTPASVRHILADGLRRKAQDDGPACVVYTAENDNHAAEFLEAIVMRDIPQEEQAAVRAKVRFLNTVIGKMSGVVHGSDIGARGLLPATPEGARAYLVEAFNHILISRIDFPTPFERGIDVFIEKTDLLPFEEAKLYGHNATHALMAYLALARGIPYIKDLSEHPDVMAVARAAFLDESGAALCKKHAGIDPLFTPEGYAAYADDLLTRMVNPFLRDSAERVGRDPARKLGWDDRLIGTMRLALAQGITPQRYALGAAAALRHLSPHTTIQFSDGVASGAAAELRSLWGDVSSGEREAVLTLIVEANARLDAWLAGEAL